MVAETSQDKGKRLMSMLAGDLFPTFNNPDAQPPLELMEGEFVPNLVSPFDPSSFRARLIEGGVPQEIMLNKGGLERESTGKFMLGLQDGNAVGPFDTMEQAKEWMEAAKRSQEAVTVPASEEILEERRVEGRPTRTSQALDMLKKAKSKEATTPVASKQPARLIKSPEEQDAQTLKDVTQEAMDATREGNLARMLRSDNPDDVIKAATALSAISDLADPARFRRDLEPEAFLSDVIQGIPSGRLPSSQASPAFRGDTRSAEDIAASREKSSANRLAALLGVKKFETGLEEQRQTRSEFMSVERAKVARMRDYIEMQRDQGNFDNRIKLLDAETKRREKLIADYNVIRTMLNDKYLPKAEQQVLVERARRIVKTLEPGFVPK
jgi:hypothetical protein